MSRLAARMETAFQAVIDALQIDSSAKQEHTEVVAWLRSRCWQA